MALRKSRITAIKKKRSEPGSTISFKTTYSKDASRKLAETRATLTRVNEKIRNAVTAGQIEMSEQLGLAQQAVESYLIKAEQQLSRLQESGEEGWEGLREDVEDSWEHLSRSIKNLVDRFSERMR